MFVLASASPRRIEMLKNAGYDPVVQPASIIEHLPFDMSPEDATMYLALQKAQAVYDQLAGAAESDSEPDAGCGAGSGSGSSSDSGSEPNALREYPDSLMSDLVVLAADTVVVLDGKIIGKPEDPDDAFAILSALRGRSHHVITGCCVIRSQAADLSAKFLEAAKVSDAETSSDTVTNPDASTGFMPQKDCFYEDTVVWFKDYTDEELWAYVNTPEPYDKAGGYAIQGGFGKYIDHIDGDYDNVVGLPLTRVKEYI